MSLNNQNNSIQFSTFEMEWRAIVGNDLKLDFIHKLNMIFCCLFCYFPLFVYTQSCSHFISKKKKFTILNWFLSLFLCAPFETLSWILYGEKKRNEIEQTGLYNFFFIFGSWWYFHFCLLCCIAGKFSAQCPLVFWHRKRID